MLRLLITDVRAHVNNACTRRITQITLLLNIHTYTHTHARILDFSDAPMSTPSPPPHRYCLRRFN